jgi:hypothetical protein
VLRSSNRYLSVLRSRHASMFMVGSCVSILPALSSRTDKARGGKTAPADYILEDGSDKF